MAKMKLTSEEKLSTKKYCPYCEVYCDMLDSWKKRGEIVKIDKKEKMSYMMGV